MLITTRTKTTRLALPQVLHFVRKYDDTASGAPTEYDLNSLQLQLELPAYTESFTPNSGGSRHAWKDFEHYKIVTEYPDESLSIPILYTGGLPRVGLGFIDICQCPNRFYCYRDVVTGSVNSHLGNLQYTTQSEPGHLVAAPQGLSELEGRALSHILPSIKSELSVLNSIIELKDFLSLKRTITHLKEVTASLYQRRMWHLPVRDILRAASDGYLQAKFNFQPLFSDIAGIATALRTSSKRVNALIARSETLQRRHYFVNLSDDRDSQLVSPITFQSTEQYPKAYGTHTIESYSSVEVSKFHVLIEYTFSFTRYQAEHARLLALLDSLGVNFNPKILWNAIPWSFVVDWFIGVNRWLDQFAIANMAPTVNIHRYCWTLSRRRRILKQMSICSNTTNDPFASNVPLAVSYESAFRRSTAFPSTSSFVTSGLSPSEFSLGAALAFSRGRRHKHRWKLT